MANNMMVVVSRAAYDLDFMMEALVQGKGSWVYAEAQLMMGILYQLGIGVRQNGLEALKWYRLAAEQSSALAWKNLGTLYLVGFAGVAVDKAEAHYCFSRARAIEIEQMMENPTIH